MTVLSINLAAQPGAPMQSVPSARAVPGRGLEGDHHFDFRKPGGGREITLIEAEAIEALERDYKMKLDPKDSRRNIVTRGIALNHLVGREFRVGDVVLRGVRLCEPCTHLEKLTGVKVLPGLVHRGGLRADIVTDGTIRVGDTVWKPEA